MGTRQEDSPKVGTLIAVTCEECQNVIHVPAWKASGKRFCSRKCKDANHACTREEAFWRYIDKSGDCWLWTGSYARGGGRMSTTRDGKSYTVSARRFSYELHRGTIPDRATIELSCANPLCCNPDHLYLQVPREAIVKREYRPRLTQDQIAEIKRMKSPNVTDREIAERFDVPRQTISRILAALDERVLKGNRAPAQPRVTLTCKSCGKEFGAVPSQKSRYCSVDCRTSGAKLTREEAFWRHVEKTDTCWIWTGGKAYGGYGQMGHKENGKTIQTIAHRFSYELHKGPIPDGMVILHTCDNPPCVNPDHLSVGTQKDNIHDAIAKGRARRNYAGRPHKPYAKLKESDVAQIREMHKSGMMPREIAGRFDTSVNSIRNIVNGVTWSK